MQRLPSWASASVSRLYLVRIGPLQRVAIFLALTVALVVVTIAVLPYLVSFGPWGYLAGFTINLLSSATVIIPAPGFASVVLMAKELNPLILGIAAGIGGTFGELSAYWLGTQGQGVLEGHRVYEAVKRHMERMPLDAVRYCPHPLHSRGFWRNSRRHYAVSHLALPAVPGVGQNRDDLCSAVRIRQGLRVGGALPALAVLTYPALASIVCRDSTMTRATAELARARPTAMSMTTRNPDMKASSMARSTEALSSGAAS